MRPLTSRTLSVLSSLALVAGAAGFSSLAVAATGGPTVVLSSTSASTTSAASIPITVAFSEGVNGFATSSISATNATVSGLSGTGASYTFNLIPSASGTVTVVVNADMATASTSPFTGNQASNMLTFTSTATAGAPVISGISATTTGATTATIMWNTDVAATGQVNYGFTSSYDASSSFDSSLSTSHTAYLGGLLANTLYHFAVMSGNGSGTTTSADQTFTLGSTGTTTATTTTPLAVTGVDVVSSSATANGTFASGWKWVVHFTVPSNETSFQLKFADFTSSSSSSTIAVANNMRYYSSQSSNASTTASAIVETNNNYGGALTLTGDTSTTTAGRQIDVTIEAAVPSGTPTGSYSTIFGALSQ